MNAIEKHDLPCPFCGAEAYIYCYEEHPEKPIYVSCSNCDCDIPLEQWNTRHQPAWENEPTNKGYYWVYDPDEWRGPYLCYGRAHALSQDWWMTDAEYAEHFLYEPRMRCCGPLVMPKEPEVKDE